MTGRRAGARPARLLRTAAAFPYLLGLVLLLAVRGPESAHAADEPPIEPAAGYVNDRAGVMDEPSRAKLEAFLDQVEKKTGAQFAVLTVKSTAPVTPSEYKVRVFEAWGIGKKGEDNGLLMLVAVEEREVRFETGYGLEGTLTDGFESRVFRDEMRPRIRAGDFAGAISAGMVACAARVAHEKGVTLTWDGRELRYTGSGRARGLPRWVALILVALFVSLVAGIVAANRAGNAGAGLPGPMIGPYRRRRTRNDWWIGGGGFGGGGFGGGGGGGFGGGSFGGFGGGSSGGGGGGGSW